MNSSTVGAKLFEPAAAKILGEKATTVINEEIKALVAQDKIGAKALINAEQVAMKRITDMEGSEMIATRRTVTLSYRGRSYTLKARNIAEEIDLRFMTRIKTLAVISKDLLPLHCEDMLVVGGDRGRAGQIDADLLGRCRAARQMANKGLSKLEDRSGTECVKWLNRHRKALTLSDSTFFVELLFFAGMVGQDGSLALHDAILGQMPSNGRTVDIQEVLAECRRIANSDFCKFCEEETQNHVADVVTKLQDLLCGRSPKWPTKMSEFMSDVRTRFAYFCVCPVGGEVGILCGAPAADHMVKEIMKKDAKVVVLKDLQGPLTYLWLLNTQSRKHVLDLRTACLANEANKKIGGVGGSASSSTAGQSCGAKKKSKGESELDAAMAAFKGNKKV